MTSPFYFYTVDGDPTSCHQQRKQRHYPTTSHLALRFPRDSSTLEQAQLKRDDLLLQRQIKLAQRFTKIQRTLQQVKARREQQALEFIQSLKNAEQKRIDYLEQVRATNKQLVERAKSIAHQHRSQTKADRERRRLDLEQRLEASERRRLNYLGLSKTTMASRMNSSDDDDMLTATPSPQAMKKKEYYSHHHHHRRHSLTALLHSFHHLGLPIISQQDTWLGFQGLGRLIRQQDVITITGKVLTLALDSSSTSPSNMSRVFLSAYMMIMCPRDILQSPETPEDKILLEAAKDLLQKFETWVDHPSRRPLRMALMAAWQTYHPLFNQWKSKDRDQLVSSMMAYYLELVSVQQVLASPTTSATDEGEDIQDVLTQQMEQLKSRVRKLGGEDAVDALMTQASTVATAAAAHQQQNNHSGDQQDTEEGGDNHESSSEDQVDQFHSVLNHLPGAYPLLTNAQLAHELILDPEFQLQAHRPDAHHNSLEERVRAMTLRAYFDAASQDIQNGDYKAAILPLLEDIRKKLLDMVQEGKPAYQMISEVLDVDLMRQQIEHGTFDVGATIDTVVQCQRRLCAPCRDTTLDGIQDRPDAPAWQLEQIMGLLDDMALDLANFRLRSLRPYLAPMAVEYEQQQFRHTHPTMELPHTSTWLQHALQKWQQTAAQRNPDHVQLNLNNRLSSPTELFHEAFLCLLINDDDTTTAHKHLLPETLEMDHQRLIIYQTTCQRLITVASLLMVAKNVGRVTSTSSLTTLTTTLLTLVTDSPSSQHITAELLRLTTTTSTTSLMAMMVQRILAHTDTVYALLGRRVMSVLKSQLLHHQFASDAVLASSSLGYITTPLQQLAGQLDTFCHHHLKVHLQWYSQCLEQQQQQQE